MKLFIKRFLFFVILFGVANILLKNYVLNDQIDYSQNEVYAEKYSYFLKNQTNFNTLFFGSSRTYRHINPKIIDQGLDKFGIRSFNLGSPGTYNPEAFSLYEDFLNNKQSDSKIKYVFLELTELIPIDRSNMFSPRSYYYLNFDNIRFITDYFNGSNKGITDKLKSGYPLLQGCVLNSLLISLPNKEQSAGCSLGENNDGYYPLDLEIKQKQTKEYKMLLGKNKKFLGDTTVLCKRYPDLKKVHAKEVNAVYDCFLTDLIKKSEEKNIQLYFIIPPRLENQLTAFNFKNDYLKKRIIEMNSMDKYPEFYRSKFSFDIAHFNSAGATCLIASAR